MQVQTTTAQSAQLGIGVELLTDIMQKTADTSTVPDANVVRVRTRALAHRVPELASVVCDGHDSIDTKSCDVVHAGHHQQH